MLSRIKNPIESRRAVTALALAASCLFGHMSHLSAQDNSIEVSGLTISLIRQSDIPARVAGTLFSTEVREGQRVQQNQIIAILENSEQALALEAAELNLKIASLLAADKLPVQTAEAQLKEAESGKVVKEVSLKIAKAEAQSDAIVEIATAETRLRELELERANNAKKSFKGSISKSQIDRLATSVAKGKLEIEQAKEDLAVMKMKPAAENAALEQKHQEINRYRSLLEQERANLVVAGVNQEARSNEVAIAKLKMEQRNVRAPFDGVVVKVEKQLGEWVEQGEPIVRVIDLKTLRVEGFLPVQKWTQKLVGKPAIIRAVAAGETIELKGKVTFVSPEVDRVLQQVRFWVDFDNANMQVSPGLSASLTIEK